MAARTCLSDQEISRKEIQVAIAKAVELRALHAALLQGNSPANLRLPTCASPSVARSSNQFSAEDYPVFTPKRLKFSVLQLRELQPVLVESFCGHVGR
ncbi:hypothetical protein MRB53_016618 [Persea americana]|uniref:Uncharacterized protein n=1 Tax=Persea americana TaxID=3435 RepID=A0ACC2M2J0_PERAE|nr:hypothetical protein MRB53_016618 [Persea americana]